MKKKEWYKSLQPIRIPSGWSVLFYKLDSIEPDTLDEEDKAWLGHFVEDILYIEKENQRKVNKKKEKQVIGVDLGWYPDGDPKGAYRLVAILDHHWEEPLLEFISRNTQEIVDQIEYWLFTYFSWGFLDEKNFRKNHPDKK